VPKYLFFIGVFLKLAQIIFIASLLLNHKIYCLFKRALSEITLIKTRIRESILTSSLPFTVFKKTFRRSQFYVIIIYYFCFKINAILRLSLPILRQIYGLGSKALFIISDSYT